MLTIAFHSGVPKTVLPQFSPPGPATGGLITSVTVLGNRPGPVQQLNCCLYKLLYE